jgi:hypothetical protein
MELSYNNLKAKSSLVKSATGLSKPEFEYLLPVFEQEWKEYISLYTIEGRPRIRKSKGRKNNTFKSVADMQVFILYDYRHNPTQEFMGLHFKMPQPKVAIWVKILEPLLEKGLAKLGLLPVRDSVKLDKQLIESVTILLDGSERPVNRPKYDQKEFYSGKKSNTL